MGHDVLIIGTGMGGSTLAYGLKDAGARVLLIERGERLPQEAQNWDAKAVFAKNRYKPAEQWADHAGRPFTPGVHYFVGGNTKVYGAALPRMRVQDFEDLAHAEGVAPGWPISYHDLAPYYDAAEHLYRVHGQAGIDPSDPPRRSPYPFGPVPDEPYIADLRDRLTRQGLRPYYLPMGIDLRAAGTCIRCMTCDGFPCRLLAKSDAEVCALTPALRSPQVALQTSTRALRLLPSPDGRRIEGVLVETNDGEKVLRADRYVLACGAVNSAALLLRSQAGGLANSSGLVGRNYMVHNNTALMAIDPLRRNPTIFQKTLAVNDFYLEGPNWPYPMGNLQLIGKLQAGMLLAARPWVPRPLLQAFANRSVDWWVMSEDLPDPENHVEARPDGQIRIHWQPNNLEAHRRLIQAATAMLKAAGYPIIQTQPMTIATNSHQCGTLRFGDDPQTSVLDAFGKSHDLENLYAVDSSFFPSSSAVNPALTIAAQALRVADHLIAAA